MRTFFLILHFSLKEVKSFFLTFKNDCGGGGGWGGDGMGHAPMNQFLFFQLILSLKLELLLGNYFSKENHSSR